MYHSFQVAQILPSEMDSDAGRYEKEMNARPQASMLVSDSDSTNACNHMVYVNVQALLCRASGRFLDVFRSTMT